MIFECFDQWDYVVFIEVIGYCGGLKQVWDNIEFGGLWLNLMCNLLNVQIWLYGYLDFFVVLVIYGSVYFVLFDQIVWDKYGFVKFVGVVFLINMLFDVKLV